MNTEDLRKRLALLINDSDNSGNDAVIDDDDIREITNIKKPIGKRPLIIDSDSDAENVSVDDFNSNNATTTNNNTKRLRSIAVDSGSDDAIEADSADNNCTKNNEFEIINKTKNNNNKKRRLIISDDDEDDN